MVQMGYALIIHLFPFSSHIINTLLPKIASKKPLLWYKKASSAGQKSFM